MDIDYGVFIGLIATVCGAGILGFSYLGAFMLGRSRGRRELELALERRLGEESEMRHVNHDRVAMVEGAVASMAKAIERLTDAQRIALLERVRQAPDVLSATSRARKHDTPA